MAFVAVLDNVNPDLSDSEFMEQEQNDLQEQGIAGSDAIDAPTPGMGADEYGMEDEDEGEIDEELAAELDLALGDEGEEGDEEGDEGEDDEDEGSDEDEDEDEDEDDEDAQARRLLNEEIRDLEAAIAKKNAEIAGSANPLIRVSFRLSHLGFNHLLMLYISASVRRCP